MLQIKILKIFNLTGLSIILVFGSPLFLFLTKKCAVNKHYNSAKTLEIQGKLYTRCKMLVESSWLILHII